MDDRMGLYWGLVMWARKYSSRDAGGEERPSSRARVRRLSTARARMVLLFATRSIASAAAAASLRRRAGEASGDEQGMPVVIVFLTPEA